MQNARIYLVQQYAYVQGWQRGESHQEIVRLQIWHKNSFKKFISPYIPKDFHKSTLTKKPRCRGLKLFPTQLTRDKVYSEEAIQSQLGLTEK